MTDALISTFLSYPLNNLSLFGFVFCGNFLYVFSYSAAAVEDVLYVQNQPKMFFVL